MLPKKFRLRAFRDFKKVFANGSFVRDSLASLKFSKNTLKYTRFAVVVSNKVSKSAVKRNKIKRRLREAIKADIIEVKPGFDVIVMANPHILDKDYGIIKETVDKLFKKSKILLI